MMTMTTEIDPSEVPTVTGLDSSPTIDQLIPALIAAQAAIRPARKTAANEHFKHRYADLADVWAACREPLAAHGFAVLHPIRAGEVHCVLLHASGQWIRSSLPLACDFKKPQDVGSWITYYRRYLLASLLAIPTEDDDGQAASAPQARREERPRAQPPNGKHADARTLAQLIRDGVAKMNAEFKDRYQDSQEEPVNVFMVERHLLKHAKGQGWIVGDAPIKERRDVERHLAALYAGEHRKDVRNELARYLTAKLGAAYAREEASRSQALPEDESQETEAETAAEFAALRGRREPGEEG
jgi:hypothetical protein